MNRDEQELSISCADCVTSTMMSRNPPKSRTATNPGRPLSTSGQPCGCTKGLTRVVRWLSTFLFHILPPVKGGAGSVLSSYLTQRAISSDLRSRDSAKRLPFGDTFGIQTSFHLLVSRLAQIGVRWFRTGTGRKMQRFVNLSERTRMQTVLTSWVGI